MASWTAVAKRSGVALRFPPQSKTSQDFDSLWAHFTAASRHEP